MEQARGASVPTQRTVLVVLYPGESEAVDDSTFTRWAHRARRFPSMNALRSSASKEDVRLERKMRYDFTKLKAKGQLRSLYRTQYANQLLVQPHCESQTDPVPSARAKKTFGVASPLTPSLHEPVPTHRPPPALLDEQGNLQFHVERLLKRRRPKVQSCIW